jgi:hypothetical protein
MLAERRATAHTAAALSAAPAVLALESILGDLTRLRTQAEVGALLGLADHTGISRKQTRVLAGQAQWIDLLTLRQGVSLAQDVPAVRAALSDAATGAGVAGDLGADLIELVGLCGEAACCLAPIARSPLPHGAALIDDLVARLEAVLANVRASKAAACTR